MVIAIYKEPNYGTRGTPPSHYGSLIIHDETARHIIGGGQSRYDTSEYMNHQPVYLAFGYLIFFSSQQFTIYQPSLLSDYAGITFLAISGHPFDLIIMD
tara:strand:+ start:137 stop:433 length:297 start_codon:yes stop_codon:yes gene_type:complete